jgi:hypothetical protein
MMVNRHLALAMPRGLAKSWLSLGRILAIFILNCSLLLCLPTICNEVCHLPYYIYYVILVWTPCIMHRCVISTMFDWCFWFFKKTFLFKQSLVPPPPPGPSHFSLRFFILSTPPPGPSHFSLRFFTLSTPPPGPSHFPLRFFNFSSHPARSFAFSTPVL